MVLINLFILVHNLNVHLITVDNINWADVVDLGIIDLGIITLGIDNLVIDTYNTKFYCVIIHRAVMFYRATTVHSKTVIYVIQWTVLTRVIIFRLFTFFSIRAPVSSRIFTVGIISRTRSTTTGSDTRTGGSLVGVDRFFLFVDFFNFLWS